MLDAFIIEELRRREQRERAERERPRLELPLDDDLRDHPDERKEKRPEEQRGVIVIDV